MPPFQANDVIRSLTEIVGLLLVVLGPWIAFAWVIHYLEQITERRLASRFGWQSVILTGWLGVPIHELSHAAMCLLFNHRIDELVLFRPDPVSGRLGYVRHSFRRQNGFEEAGNLFIGIAPLLGGTLVLTALTWLFYPAAIQVLWEATATSPDGWRAGGGLEWIRSAAGQMVSAEHGWSGRLVVYLYLVLCVGLHMAPSPSDYVGAGRGFVRVVLPLLLIGALAAGWTSTADELAWAILDILGPIWVIMCLSIVLCLIACALVWLVTAPFPVRYRLSERVG